jgi:hypothetical protein
VTKKRLWQEPQVRSITQLPEVYGLTCGTGTSASGVGNEQCANGQNATTIRRCTTGNGAKDWCNTGNGVV